MAEFNAFDLFPIVNIDWDFANKSVEGLDVTAKQEGRLPMEGKTAVRVLAEYAAIAHRCLYLPGSIVVSPPHVWFCPVHEGLSGAFVEEYSETKHGIGVSLTKEPDLFAYTNIDARLDAWRVCAEVAGRRKP